MNQQSNGDEPTLAEFREYLVDLAADGSFAQQAIGGSIVRIVDRYNDERPTQGRTTRYDLAPWEDAHGLANGYEEARDSDDPRALDQFLDNLAEDFHLEDVRALRTATAAVQAAMGRIALAARLKGMSPDRIAAETGYTASRITQFIREEKQRLATP